MLRLLVLTLMLTATPTVNGEGGINIGGIISNLNQKAKDILRNVAIPALNNQVSLVKAHIDGIVSFFKAKEGDIPVPNTPFNIHYVADRCHLIGIGKRILIVDFQTCKARATESQTGLSSTCQKGSQKDAIECATEKVLNLVKIVSLAIKNKGNNPTTVFPTTVVPTTVLRTTVVPTTVSRTTLVPTTVVPTTVSRTTLVPTTVVPTTVSRTTLVPTTVVPTTVVPTTVSPTTVFP